MLGNDNAGSLCFDRVDFDFRSSLSEMGSSESDEDTGEVARSAPRALLTSCGERLRDLEGEEDDPWRVRGAS